MNENAKKITELLDDSLETLADRKKFSKTMNSIMKDCAKKIGVKPSVIKKAKDYRHYKGANWENGNPLKLDKDKKDKYKISPTFMKLAEIVENLREIGDREFLEPYLKAMDNLGIHITIGFDEDKLGRLDEVNEVLESASRLQTNVDALTEELKEEKSTEAEELNFTPKNAFCNVLGILDKIKEGKDVEDTIQNRFTEITMLNNAYTYLSSENDKSKQEEE